MIDLVKQAIDAIMNVISTDLLIVSTGISAVIELIFRTLAFIIIHLVYAILQPIDAMILATLPDLSHAFTAIANLFTMLSTYIGWCVSLTGLPPEALALIVAYYTFKLTAPMFLYMIKLAIAWWNKLMA